jgi:hypothetical protein
MLLCIDSGREAAVSTDDTDPRLLELCDDRRDLIDGVGGSGFSSSFPNSLNSLSNPGCIWRAIMGKWFSKSPNDLTSFFRGMDELPAAEEPPAAGGPGALTSSCTASVAGTMGVAS